MNKICVTGADGFIGRSLCKHLIKSNKSVSGFVRKLNPNMKNDKVKYIEIGDLSSKPNITDYIFGYDCIIHCAGKAHAMNKESNLDTFRLVNSEATKYLAEQAAKAGVKRFIFLSSVKVNGENTNSISDKLSFKKDGTPNPQDAYSMSKLEAENYLWNISENTNLEVVVIRLPLVYGYGVKGNMRQLMKLINLGIPLPLGLVNNQRSLIGIDNLNDVINRCIDHSEAAGKTFLVSDGEDLSTPELIKHMASAMGSSVYLFSFPLSLLKFIGFVLRRQNETDRLMGSLKIDIHDTKKILNWTPPLSIKKGIERMVKNK